MVTGVAMSYSYLDNLMNVHKNLSYRRIKSMFAPPVNGIIDKYEILLSGKH